MHGQRLVDSDVTNLVVRHARFVASRPPAPGYFIRVCESKKSVTTVPPDAVLVLAVRQKLQQKLPQLQLSSA